MSEFTILYCQKCEEDTLCRIEYENGNWYWVDDPNCKSCGMDLSEGSSPQDYVQWEDLYEPYDEWYIEQAEGF